MARNTDNNTRIYNCHTDTNGTNRQKEGNNVLTGYLPTI